MRESERLTATRRDLAALDRLVHTEFISRDEALKVVADEARSVRVENRSDLATIAAANALKVDRLEYEHAHSELISRVDGLRDLVAAIDKRLGEQTGTASGTTRFVVVSAVVISLLGLIVTVVHLLNG